MQNRNNESAVTPSILVAKVEVNVHIENDVDAANVESKLNFHRNMVVHYNKKIRCMFRDHTCIYSRP